MMQSCALLTMAAEQARRRLCIRNALENLLDGCSAQELHRQPVAGSRQAHLPYTRFARGACL